MVALTGTALFSQSDASDVRILMLDSGVGGLSVFKEVIEHPISCSIDYICDHLYFPYGLKNAETIIERVHFLVSTAMSESQTFGKRYQAIVIACNTASTQVLEHLRKEFSVPVVGVVPAVKPAAEQSQNGKIGLLATEATAQGVYLKSLIRDFAPHVDVEVLGSAELVDFAEAKLAGQSINLDELTAILTPFRDKQVDQLILGCTHFPLLKNEIAAVCDWPVQLVDSGSAIARRLYHVLSNEVARPCDQNISMTHYHRFLTTAKTLPDVRLLHAIFHETSVNFAKSID